jgi:Tir chaperone protein (CesT) family
MAHDAHLAALLAEIAQRSRLPLALDERGSCGIAYGNGSEIGLTSLDDGEGLLLHAPIQFLDQVHPLTQLRRCMELNLNGVATNGAALALDPDSDWITLWRRLRVADLDSQRMEQAIIEFASVADDLRTRLAFQSPATGAPVPTADEDGFIRV